MLVVLARSNFIGGNGGGGGKIFRGSAAVLHMTRALIYRAVKGGATSAHTLIDV
jgi:hypothetical protein